MSKDLIAQAADVTANLPAVQISRADIRTHFCPMATDVEIAMALSIVKSLKLNPFLREVHFIKYSQKDKMAIVVGYEVYLKRAERSGKLNGWSAGINTAENFAWVKIYRKDWKEPFEWTVNLAEFNKKQSTWNQIPSFMGRKVAIAQGFRLCFPDEVAGLPYTEEEHQVYDIDTTAVSTKPEVREPQALPTPNTAGTQEPEPEKTEKPHDEDSKSPAKPKENLIGKAMQDKLEKMALQAFAGKKKEYLQWLGDKFGLDSIDQLSEAQAEVALAELRRLIKGEGQKTNG